MDKSQTHRARPLRKLPKLPLVFPSFLRIRSTLPAARARKQLTFSPETPKLPNVSPVFCTISSCIPSCRARREFTASYQSGNGRSIVKLKKLSTENFVGWVACERIRCYIIVRNITKELIWYYQKIATMY